MATEETKNQQAEEGDALAQIRARTQRQSMDIAIIGMACRFPGSSNWRGYWANLRDGVNSIQEVTPDRWDVKKYYSPNIDEPNKSVGKWSGMVVDRNRFDNQFFNISPREALNVEPQQRVLLEESWRCIEDSGVPLERLQAADTSVYVGLMATSYHQETSSPGLVIDGYAGLGNYNCIAANRISYAFGLQGPSLSIDVACASSLVAMHKAKLSLEQGESQYALAAGICLNNHLWKYIVLSKARMLSPDGQCKTFDKDANGYVPGEGVGVVLMQPLQQAIADGNTIYGVIKGSAVNHVGRSASLSAPRVEGQRDVLLSAYVNADVNPNDVTYLEAHGTGTSLGDPIEIEALNQVFGHYTEDRSFCGIGSVKTNIGHLEAGAGIAGVIKVLLMMRHRTMAPTLNLKTVNPMINFEASPFFPVREATPWQPRLENGPLLAGISAFGFGGANAHLVLSSYEPPPSPAKDAPPSHQLFMLSARTPRAMRRLWERWQTFAAGEEFAAMDLEDLCATVMRTRTRFNLRCGIVVSSKTELREWLTGPMPELHQAEHSSPAVIFSDLSLVGWRDLAPLYDHEPIFREAFDTLLRELAETEAAPNWDWHEAIRAPEWPAEDIATFRFCVGLTLFRTLIQLGLKPNLVTTQPVKRYLAFCAAGILKPGEALALLRGERAIHQVTFGRPSLPFYDPVNDQLVRRYRITADWLRSLVKDLQVTTAEAKAFQQKAQLLLKTQFTFLKIMKKWAGQARKAGIDLLSVINRDDLPEADQCRERLLALVAVSASLNRVSIKWNLSDLIQVEDGRFGELVSLITAQLMTQEDAVNLLLDRPLDLEQLAEDMTRRQTRLNPDFDYRHLEANQPGLIELGDMEAWIDNAHGISGETIARRLENNHRLITIGRLKNDSADHGLVFPNRENRNRAFLELLLQLALTGLPLDWAKVYPEGMFRKQPLPIYPFDRRSFWLVGPRLQIDSEVLAHHVRTDIVRLLAQKRGLRPEDIELDATFEQLGFDEDALLAFDYVICDHYKVEMGPPFSEETPGKYIERMLEECRDGLVHFYADEFDVVGGEGDETIAPGMSRGAAYELDSQAVEAISLPRDRQAATALPAKAPADSSDAQGETRYFQPVFVPLPRREDVGSYQWVSLIGPAEDEALADALIEAHRCESAPGRNLNGARLLDERFWNDYVNALSHGKGVIYFMPPSGLTKWDERLTPLADQSQTLLGGLLLLCKALDSAVRRKRLDPPHLKIVTAGAYALTTSHPPHNPMGAAMAGMCSSLATEYPDWSVSVVDLSPHERETWPACARQIAAESFSADSGPILLRGGMRFRRTFQQLELPVPRIHPHLRRGGRYLILGGSGGIGKRIGLHLQRQFGARVCLVGRRSHLDSDLPPGVIYHARDIADATAMEDLIRKLEVTWGGIDGVFHSADAPYSRLIRDADLKGFMEGLRPKLEGSAVLAGLFAERNLDFMVYFSSIAGLFPVQGGSAYAAANAFVDAFALYLRRIVRFPVKTIDWGLWKDTGLAVHFQDRHLKSGFQPFVGEEGETACTTVLAGFAEQVLPLKASPEHFAERGFEKTARATQLANPLPHLPRNWHMHIVHTLRDQFERQGEISSVFPALDGLVAKLLLYRMADWGISFLPGTQLRMGSEISRLGVIEKYHRLFRAMVGILQRRGWLEADGLYLRVSETIMPVLEQRDQAEQEKQHFIKANPVYDGFVRLLEASLTDLRGVLSGQKPFAEVLFPDGSMDLVQPIYRDNPNADFFNRLVAQTLVSFAHIHERTLAKPAVLEVGAGTGGTSVFVFDALIKNQIDVQYNYTDVSHAFTNYGRQRFASLYPHIDFKVLNLEQDLAAQGFKPGEFDFIFGSNVVHATRNVRDTLARLKSLLRPGGLLVLNEITAVQDFATLTFGLTEGWWLYEDQGRRLPDSPLLDVPRWSALLESLGFYPVWLPVGEQGSDNWIQHVLVAASDGRIETKLFKAALDLNQAETPVTEATPAAAAAAPAPAAAVAAPAAVDAQAGRDRIRAALADYLRDIFGNALKFDFKKVGEQEEFSEFGVDSLIVIEVQERLNRDIGNMPNTLLFQYRTIAELSEYLLKNHPDDLAKILPAEVLVPVAAPPTPVAQPVAPAPAAPTVTAVAPTAAVPQRAVVDEPIAIVGVAGRYPKSPNLDAFWDNLAAGNGCIDEVPAERWDVHRWFAPHEQQSRAGRMYSKWGGFIDDIACFDPLFFGISPKEARAIDPQERLMLELAWSAIEDAGHRVSDLRGGDQGNDVGVFIGVTGNTYQWLGIENWHRGGGELVQSFPWSIANRISFQLNFSGPSMPIDTACSSSLAAIHFAAASLRRGECRSALVGGVNLYLHPAKYAYLCHMTMLSRDEKCRAFGKGANGFVPGEGAGMLLLRPLSEALADGDHIYAVLRGSAVNHGGRTNGFTVPDPGAQADLIAAALDDAGLQARDIDYIEAHGTGTLLGDPVEVEGLTQAFRRAGGSDRCYLGSVKSNIGHLESAAGVAAVTKVLLQMRHRTLVPTLHAEPANPYIDFNKGPFQLVHERRAWDGHGDAPLRAGISSFGAGGFNAHVILESFVTPQTPNPVSLTAPNSVLVLSARDETRLGEAAERMAAYLAQHGRADATWLRDLCFTLQTGREAMATRLAVCGSGLADFQSGLAAYLEGRETRNVFTGQAGSGVGKATFGEDEEDRAYMEMLVKAGKWNKIAAFWVEGVALDWTAFYAPGEARRLALPAYPFARDTYWLRKQEKSAGDRLGPLLDRLVPSFDPRVVFTRHLPQTDPLVRDNLIDDTPYLPHVTQLETALAAARETLPDQAMHAHEVTWYDAVVADKDQDLQLSLYRNGEGADTLTFELGAASPHCRGRLSPIEGEPAPEPQTRRPADLTERVLNQEAGRAALRERGVTLSDTYACFRTLHIEGNTLAFDYTVNETTAQNGGARPRLVHAALCAAHLLPALQHALYFPMNLAALNEWAPTAATGSLWLHIDNAGWERAGVSVELRDGDGAVTCRYEGLLLSAQADPAMPTFTYLPGWREDEHLEIGGDVPQRLGSYLVIQAGNRADAWLPYLAENHRGSQVVDCSLGQSTRRLGEHNWCIDPHDRDGFNELLRDCDQFTGIYFIACHDPSRYQNQPEAMAQDAEQQCLLLLRLIKAADQRGFLQHQTTLHIVTNGAEALANEPVSPVSAALHGLAKTIACEYPRLRLSVLDFDTNDAAFDLAAAVTTVVRDAGRERGAECLIRNGVRYTRCFQPLRLSMSADHPFQNQGVYVIVGGARGIGYETARYLAGKVAARLVLVGRAPQDAAVEEKLAALAELGGEAEYLAADIANPDGVERLADHIRKGHGKINGVFHSAIVLRDHMLADMSEADFLAAMAPKVRGGVLLAKAVARFNPDFLIFYSSAKSFVGDPGQGNYAAASAFEDALAPYFERVTNIPVYTLDWGFWSEVGIVADHQVKDRYARQGIGGIHSREGMSVVHRQIGAGVRRVLAIKADPARLTKLGVDYRDPRQVVVRKGNISTTSVPRAMAQLRMDTSPNNEELQAFALLDHWVRRRVWLFFEAQGSLVAPADGAALTRAAVIAKLGINPRYTRLTDALLEMLVREGALRQVAGGYRVMGAPRDFDLAETGRYRRAAEERHPLLTPYFSLAETCLNAFDEVLSGRRDPAAVLFPNGSMDAVQAVYRGNRRVDYFNEQSALAVRTAVIEAMRKSRGVDKIRILEFGAGTGGTTAFLLRELEEFAAYLSYDYTDVSPAFTQHGRRHFNHSFVNFRTFDIERDAVAQGFEPGSYDIVVGANVIHAVTHLDQVTRNLKALLKRGGLMLLNEVTSLIDFSTVTFGLTRGWWAFTDNLRMPHAPLLDAPRWLRFLAQTGFQAGFAVGEPAANHSETRQVIVGGYSDGIVPAGSLPHAETPSLPAAATPPTGLSGQRSIPLVITRPATAAAAATPSAPVATVTVDLATRIEQAVCKAVAGAIELAPEAVDRETAFSEYGVDSVIGIGLVEELNSTLGLSLRHTAIFDYPDAASLSNHLHATYGAQIGSFLAASQPKPVANAPIADTQRAPAAVNGDSGYSHASGAKPYAGEAGPLTLERILEGLANGELTSDQADALLAANQL